MEKLDSLRDKGFISLLMTQFLGAFNDNAFKTIVSLLVVDSVINKTGGAKYLSVAGALFILPFILFSPSAGYLGDRFSKREVMVKMKISEIGIMFLGLLALQTRNVFLLFFALFLMGLQSTIFSPSKYGILPEIIRDRDLSRANGVFEMTTVLAIMLGTAAGGVSLSIFRGKIYYCSFFLILLAVIGTWSSLKVPAVPPANPHQKFRINIVKKIYADLRKLKSYNLLWWAALASAYFWFLGALLQLDLILYGKNLMALSEGKIGILLSSVAVGIGIGSILAARLSGEKVELGLVPLGAVGIGIFSLDLYFSSASFFRTSVDLILLGSAGGLYIVPLNAFIQQKSPPEERGKIIAITNFISFSGILFASFILWFLSDLVHLKPNQIIILFSLVTFFVTFYLCRQIPEFLQRFVS